MYVDDFLVTAMNADHVADFFEEKAVLEIKNLGSASRFLRIRVDQTTDGCTSLDQELEIMELLEANGMANANSVVSIASGIGGRGQEGRNPIECSRSAVIHVVGGVAALDCKVYTT